MQKAKCIIDFRRTTRECLFHSTPVKVRQSIPFYRHRFMSAMCCSNAMHLHSSLFQGRVKAHRSQAMCHRLGWACAVKHLKHTQKNALDLMCCSLFVFSPSELSWGRASGFPHPLSDTAESKRVQFRLHHIISIPRQVAAGDHNTDCINAYESETVGWF